MSVDIGTRSVRCHLDSLLAERGKTLTELSTEVGVTVAGHTSPTRSVFMVGPAGRSPEAAQVEDRAEAVQMVLRYLLDVVKEVKRLRER